MPYNELQRLQMKNHQTFRLCDYSPAADGVIDDTDAFLRCFGEASGMNASTIIIGPGPYRLMGKESIPLSSHQRVIADGAEFLLPEELGDQARITLFAGEDLCDFHWRGGRFVGHCFDHRNQPNTWDPNVNTRGILITTSEGGTTERVVFDSLEGDGLAGAVITVSGASASPADRSSRTYATGVTVRNCHFERCGKFMWDYGLLWQILVWPEEYDEASVAMAKRYFFSDLIQGPMQMNDGDDRVLLDNAAAGIAVSKSAENDESICFFGDTLPENIRRGKQYYVTDATDDSIRIAEVFGGDPIRFEKNSGPAVSCITDLHKAYYHLYAPAGAGPGKGGLDLVICRDVIVIGNRMSALGDTMHIQASENVIFSANQITGSRMGAFFIAEFCSNVSITGNTVNGTNGSRVMSLEKNCEDITITGNTFLGGGRGSWINQPQGIILSNNIFVDNTTKGEADPWRGRKLFTTGDWERYPELYFTTFEEGGTYGPVIVENNVFKTGSCCKSAIRFEANGHDILVRGNSFQEHARHIEFEQECPNVLIKDNVGIEAVTNGKDGIPIPYQVDRKGTTDS